MENKKQQTSFIKGAVILGVAGILVKILGAIFKIPLANIITDEGFGYYNAAYPIYVMLLSIATTGFPIAISKMVSERRAKGDIKGGHKVFKITLIILGVIGIVTSAIVFFNADFIVNVILGNKYAYYPLIALAPALLIVPLMSAFRGYFQGRNNMAPTAISQIFEQIGRVVFGLSLAIILLPKGLTFSAAGASFGAAAGAIFGTLTVWGIYLKNKKTIKSELENSEVFDPEPASKIIKELLQIAVPIIIGSMVMPLMNFIDAAVVIRRLQEIGHTLDRANALYGQLGMAATLINLPQIVTAAIAMSLVPVISKALAVGNLKEAQYNAKLATRTTTLIGLPASVGLMALATPIMTLLYPKTINDNSGRILFILGAGVICLSLIQTFTAILQGMGKAYVPVVNLFIGAIAKVICTYTLTAIPSLNVSGAAIGTVVAYFIAALLDLMAIKKALSLNFEVKDYVIKPVTTSLIMGVTAIIIYKITFALVPGDRYMISNLMGTAIAIIIAAIVYAIALFKTKTITEDEVKLIPKGEKITKIMKKAKII